jgi:hypothetical protein
MSDSLSGGAPDIERLALRLAQELEAYFVELTCPVCHMVSGKIAVQNLQAQRAFDTLHKFCYVKPFADSRI